MVSLLYGDLQDLNYLCLCNYTLYHLDIFVLRVKHRIVNLTSYFNYKWLAYHIELEYFVVNLHVLHKRRYNFLPRQALMSINSSFCSQGMYLLIRPAI